MKKGRHRGFTLVELMVTMALIAVLVGAYLMMANPAGQLASSRNTRRKTDLQNIMLAIKENVLEGGTEQFICSSGAIPTSTKTMGSASGSYNIAPCLIPADGIAAMPFDPLASSAYYTSPSNYNTGYTIIVNGSGTITLGAPSAELGKTITYTQ